LGVGRAGWQARIGRRQTHALQRVRGGRGSAAGYLLAAAAGELLNAEGPDITQAGGTNYRSIALCVGFAGHPSAWEHHEIVYYAHPVDPSLFSGG
jgi:hypothetical protein